MGSLDDLAKAKYLALTTFRRDGTPITTAVWCVRDGDRLLVTTQGSSGKVKRIRALPSVTVATCTARGKLTGEPMKAQATLLGEQETAATTKAIARRYGLLGRILTRSGKHSDRVGISIVLE